MLLGAQDEPEESLGQLLFSLCLSGGSVPTSDPVAPGAQVQLQRGLSSSPLLTPSGFFGSEPGCVWAVLFVFDSPEKMSSGSFPGQYTNSFHLPYN